MAVEVGILASNAALKLLARNRPTTLDALRALNELLPWQVDAFGALILETLAKPVQPLPTRRGR